MQKRRLGCTDIWVSELGLGTVKFGRNQGVKYPQAFDLPTDDVLVALLQEAKALGINLLDTAPAYGQSEERLGKLLAQQRHDWVLSTKVGEEFINDESHFAFSAAAIIKSVERSLKRLCTDYLDIILVHSDGDDQVRIEQDEVFLTLQQLKSAGKIRAYGMSTKTVVGGMLTVEQADVAMVSFHPGYRDEQVVIARAQELQKGILVKKALASGNLQQLTEYSKQHTSQQPSAQQNLAAAALQFVLAEPGVTSVIVGTIDVRHLRENVGALNGAF